MTMANGQESSLLAAMPPGIGDLTFASEVWVDAAREILTNAATQHADALAASLAALREQTRLVGAL